MHPQSQGVSTRENIARWNPESSVRRKIAYHAQDVPVRPRDAVESPGESIEAFLNCYKPRLEPIWHAYENLKSFLEKAGEDCEPPAVPMPLSELGKSVL